MPIKDGKYKNPNWVDGGPPAVDADELNAISSTLESLDAAGGTGGDGKRYARIVIGTSTNGWTAADCDYLCDGVDDQAEINQAIEALPYMGGEILLLDGTYNINGYVGVLRNSTLRGTNRESTILKRLSTNGYDEITDSILVVSNSSVLADMTIDGNKSIWPESNAGERVSEILAGGGAIISNITIRKAINSAIYYEQITAGVGIIEDCSFSVAKQGIYIDCSGNILISRCYFEVVDTLVYAHGINIRQGAGEETMVSPLSCVITDCTSLAGTGDIILDGTGFSKVQNCNLGTVIFKNSYPNGSVAVERGRHIIMGNTFQPNTYNDNAISFANNVNNCIAIGNTLASGSMRIQIEDNGENNIIYNGASGGQVILTTSGWSANTQTVTAPGVTVSNYVTTGPTPTAFNAAMEAGVYCSGQGNGTLTFTCTKTPSGSITYTYTAQEVL